MFPNDIEIPKELADIRNSRKLNPTLYEIFKNKMDNLSLPNIKKIIVCGEFALTYFDKYNKDDTSKTPKWSDEKNIIVPHPSRGQWQFILEHQNSLTTLKNLFEELKK